MNINRSNERKWFQTKKKTNNKTRNPAETINDADYADDQAYHANTPAQAGSQLHNLEQAARDTGFYLNSDKTAFKCFDQDDTIFSLNGKPMK